MNRSVVIPAQEPESIKIQIEDNGSRRSDVSVKPGIKIPGNRKTNPRNEIIEKGGGMKKMRGFTLLEVMIALLVITLGMGAVINTTGESGWKSAQLKQGTIANWVAQNQIAEYRAKRTWNNATKKSGEVEMANTEWVWQMKISKTDDPSLRRLDVDVFIKGEDVLKASVTGFIGLL
jgi:general secretion pathway protein I